MAKLRWQCAEGHQWEASLNSIKNGGSWCPTCAKLRSCLSIEVAKDIAAARGGICVSERYDNIFAHLLWRCSQGHEWSANLNNVKQGTWCPYCAAGKSEQSVRGIFETI